LIPFYQGRKEGREKAKPTTVTFVRIWGRDPAIPGMKPPEKEKRVEIMETVDRTSAEKGRKEKGI